MIEWRVFARRYLLLHLAVAVLAALFLLLDRYAVFDGILLCPLHLWGLYCPTCGMTRAAHCLLRLDLAGVVRYHPGLFAVLACLLYYEGFLLAALLRRRLPSLRRAGFWPLLLLGGLLLLFAVVRNVLLLGYGIDPVGDFL